MCASLGMGGCVDIVPDVPPRCTPTERFRCLDGVVEFDEESYGRYGGRERCRVHLSLLPTSTPMPSFRVGDGPLVVVFDTPVWKGWEFGGLFVTDLTLRLRKPRLRWHERERVTSGKSERSEEGSPRGKEPQSEKILYC